MEPRQFNQRRGQTRVGGSQRVFPNRLIVPLNPLGLESGSSFALECIRVAPLPADLLIYSTTKMGRHREATVNRADVWTLTFVVQRISARFASAWILHCLQISVSHSDQVEKTVQAQDRQCVVGALLHERLRPEGNAHAGNAEHGKIVRSVAYGNHLLQRDVLLPDNLLKKLGLLCSIHYLRLHLSTDGAVDDVEFVRKDVVDTEARLQMPGEEGKATGQDRCFVAEELQGTDQLLGAFDERNFAEQFLHAILGQSPQKRDSASEALLEFDLTTHGRLCDLRDLIRHPRHLRQFVDDFTLNQGGVHIKRKQTAVAPEDALALEGDIDHQLLSCR